MLNMRDPRTKKIISTIIVVVLVLKNIKFGQEPVEYQQ